MTDVPLTARQRTVLAGRADSVPERAAFFTHCEGPYHTEVARRELTGMETWFAALDPTAAAPPRWKTAVGSGIGIFRISLPGNGLLGRA